MAGTLVLSALAFVSAASAFDSTKLGQRGTITLDMPGISDVLKHTPKLRREVEEAAAKLNKKPDEIVCDGMRFPGSWPELAGLRVAPYICQFGDRWLKIETKIRVVGKGGKVYEKITREAMRRAIDVKETSPTWVWSDTEPPEP